MPRTIVAIAVALVLAGAVSGASQGAAASSAGEPPAATDGDCHRAESERFVFHSDPWVNLHHFLFQWARNTGPRRPEDRRRAVDVSEQGGLETLDEQDRESWQRAVDDYRERLVPSALLFDRDLIALRGRLASMACSAAGPESMDGEPGPVLTDAMSVYRRHWWPGHHAANMAWIRGELELLESYEKTLARQLAEAYGGEWPPERIRVDVVAYSNWAGAYTTNHPNHLTISGTSFQGLEGLEILFHEVSHASFFEQRILGQLAAAFRPHGAETPDRLAHVIQFVTPAELVRSLVSAEEQDGLTLIADRMAQRSRLKEDYRIVLEHWKPFLAGRVERAEALDLIAAELVR